VLNEDNKNKYNNTDDILNYEYAAQGLFNIPKCNITTTCVVMLCDNMQKKIGSVEICVNNNKIQYNNIDVNNSSNIEQLSHSIDGNTEIFKMATKLLQFFGSPHGSKLFSLDHNNNNHDDDHHHVISEWLQHLQNISNQLTVDDNDEIRIIQKNDIITVLESLLWLLNQCNHRRKILKILALRSRNNKDAQSENSSYQFKNKNIDISLLIQSDWKSCWALLIYYQIFEAYLHGICSKIIPSLLNLATNILNNSKSITFIDCDINWIPLLIQYIRLLTKAIFELNNEFNITSNSSSSGNDDSDYELNNDIIQSELSDLQELVKLFESTSILSDDNDGLLRCHRICSSADVSLR